MRILLGYSIASRIRHALTWLLDSHSILTVYWVLCVWKERKKRIYVHLTHATAPNQMARGRIEYTGPLELEKEWVTHVRDESERLFRYADFC